MPTTIVFLVFLLHAGFFLGFGWHFRQLNKMWPTQDYGGTLYKRELLKALAYGAFLVVAAVLCRVYEIPKEATDTGVLASALFFPVGWWLRVLNAKQKSASSGGPSRT